jgi:hypothetical protein
MAVENYQSVISIIAAGNFAQIVQHWRIVDPTGNDPWENADGFIDGFSALVANNYAARLQEMLAEDDSFISAIWCRRVLPAGGPQSVKVFTPGERPGQFPGHTDSCNVAGCIIWLPQTPDAKNGRTFFPGVSQQALVNGVWSTAYRTAALNLGNTLIDDGIDSPVGTFFPALRSKGVPPTFSQIKYGYLSSSPGTQRRRSVPI